MNLFLNFKINKVLLEGLQNQSFGARLPVNDRLVLGVPRLLEALLLALEQPLQLAPQLDLLRGQAQALLHLSTKQNWTVCWLVVG